MLRLCALLALLFFVGAARAEPEPAAAPLDLTAARILASPGWPGALKAFLPPGREVEPLALPLPPGPVLVLGLVDRDPAARAAGESLLGWKPGEDLHGGYVVEARKDGDRALAVILAADAAALAAARFELETFTPTAKEKEPRSVEFQQPDEQGGVRIAAGRRTVRPKFRIRAAAGLGPGETVLDVAAAHANRMWVSPDVTDRDLTLLRDHGVEPVAWARLAQPRDSDDESNEDEILPVLVGLQSRGVRRFALDVRRSPAAERGSQLRNRLILAENRMVQRFASALRPGGLMELLVLPFGAWPSDDDCQAVRGVPEATLGWSGPSEEPLEITREEAERRRKEVGVPLVLVETWMKAAAGKNPRIPSLPRGRAGDLGDVLDGVVVLPGPGSAAALAAAWSPPETDTFAEMSELLGVCVQNAKDGPTFLLESAACLEQTLLGRYADPPWLRDLPQRMRESAATLPENTVLARWIPGRLEIDGKLDEPAWSRSVTDGSERRVTLSVVSNGDVLTFGLRVPDEALLESCRLYVQVGTSPAIEITLPPSERAPGTPREPFAVAESRSSQVRSFEVALGHYALGGDPYPTRRFGFRRLMVFAENPGSPRPPEPTGVLLVTR